MYENMNLFNILLSKERTEKQLFEGLDITFLYRRERMEGHSTHCASMGLLREANALAMTR
jgi:hypothetical protein